MTKMVLLYPAHWQKRIAVKVAQTIESGLRDGSSVDEVAQQIEQQYTDTPDTVLNFVRQVMSNAVRLNND
jgi:hypothetical protein